MNQSAEHRTLQTLKGINEIREKNSETGQTVLWMGGYDVGPILDDAVERERIRSSVEFARRVMDLQRQITNQKKKIVELQAGIDKCHEREVKDAGKIELLNKLTKAVTSLLDSCGIQGDIGNGLQTLRTQYHAMTIGVTP